MHMQKLNGSDRDTIAIVAVVLSLISIPYIDWWGLLVGPCMVIIFSWAYYSMFFVVWIIDAFKRIIGRA